MAMNRGNDPNPFDEEEPEVNPFSVSAYSIIQIWLFLDYFCE